MNGLIIFVGLGVFFLGLVKLGDFATRNTARKIANSVDTKQIVKDVLKARRKK